MRYHGATTIVPSCQRGRAVKVESLVPGPSSSNVWMQGDGVASIVTANPAGNAAKPNTNVYVLSLSSCTVYRCMQPAMTDFAPGFESAPAPPTTG